MNQDIFASTRSQINRYSVISKPRTFNIVDYVLISFSIATTAIVWCATHLRYALMVSAVLVTLGSGPVFAGSAPNRYKTTVVKHVHYKNKPGSRKKKHRCHTDRYNQKPHKHYNSAKDLSRYYR